MHHGLFGLAENFWALATALQQLRSQANVWRHCREISPVHQEKTQLIHSLAALQAPLCVVSQLLWPSEHS